MSVFLKQMFFLFGIISMSCASKSFSYKDTVLTGSVIKTLQNVDWLQCFELCFSKPECLSYNFCPSSRDTVGICQLNSCGVDTVKLCGKNKALCYQKHCVFHQFKENQPGSVECLGSHQNQPKECMVTGNFTCTGSMSMYADGYPAQVITREGQSKPVVLLPCPSLMNPPISLQLPRDTRVVSIEVYQRNSDDDSPEASIIGGFSDGLVTSAQWKCAYDVPSAEWRLPSFNDSSWSYAKVIQIGDDDEGEDMRIVNIPYHAKWIKYKGFTKRSLCRIKRK